VRTTQLTRKKLGKDYFLPSFSKLHKVRTLSREDAEKRVTQLNERIAQNGQ
jgi:hypothetical protein